MSKQIFDENNTFNVTTPHPVNNAICLSGLGTVPRLCCSVGKSTVIIRPAQMTAMDIIQCLESMEALAKDLLACLEENCDTCDEGCECELHNDDSFERVEVSPHLLRQAGIPADAKLYAAVNEDNGTITISEALAANDLSDVPASVRAILTNAGICFEGLESALAEGNVIYGGV